MSRTKRSEQDHLLPSNAFASERSLSLAASFGDDILPEDIKSLWNLKTVPARFLSFLAWGLHVDFWRDELDETYKRELIGSSFAWHRKKGTPWAVKKVLADLGVDAVIHEWHDIGTAPHTFAVEATYKGDPAHVPDFLGNDTNRLLLEAIEDTKPERSHITYLIVLPTWPDGEDGKDHWCVYGYCAYGHGYLHDERIHLGPVDDASEDSIIGNLNGYGYLSLRSAYSRRQMYGAARYGETFEFAKLAFSGYDLLVLYADREFLPSEGRRWKNQRPQNGAWRFGDTWLADNHLLGAQTDAWETAKACAAYGHSSYGGLAYMGPRYWKVERTGRYGYTAYGESGAGEPGWEPICEFHVESDDLALDVSGIMPGGFLGTVERTDMAFVLPPVSPAFDDLWTDADLNVWRDDKSWIGSGTWVRYFEIAGDALLALFSGHPQSTPAEWTETRGDVARHSETPEMSTLWTDNIMNTWQPEKNWLAAGTWLKDSGGLNG